MKKVVLLLSALLLTAVVAVAQDAPSPNAAPAPHEPQSTATQSIGSQLRGCLSGSTGNFTLTDRNGVQYKLVGGDTDLQSKVGHEVQVSGTPVHANGAASGNGESMPYAEDRFQVAGVEDVSNHCELTPGGTPPINENARPEDESSPKGARPSIDQPAPQQTAMLLVPAMLPKSGQRPTFHGPLPVAMATQTARRSMQNPALQQTILTNEVSSNNIRSVSRQAFSWLCAISGGIIRPAACATLPSKAEG